MFEKTLINLLAADSDLQSLLSTFESIPAIFSSAAPQKAERPYIVFDIDKGAPENLAAASFDVVLDIYDRQESGKELREIAERIEFVCDRALIRTDAGGRFQAIRLFYEDYREVENTDVKIRHGVVRLSARAGRKKWAEETISR
jgi:hypothetical protein